MGVQEQTTLNRRIDTYYIIFTAHISCTYPRVWKIRLPVNSDEFLKTRFVITIYFLKTVSPLSCSML